MSISEGHQSHKVPTGFSNSWPADLSLDTDEDLAAELREERTRWKLLALGAIALYLFFIVVLFWGPVWLVAVGPFVLLLIGRLMGIRRLDGSSDDKRQTDRSVSRRARAATLNGHVSRSPYWRRKSTGGKRVIEETTGRISPGGHYLGQPKNRQKRQSLTRGNQQ